ncbi:hypothetical protein K493DRAFT_308089 [Basidiobolus meristosporus CBS 931.73]|uniref:Mitochondrial import inner membrane translocase subunit TIM50 n=1 Tax=Basidiobolus meristosporus CBS 931.73 TaxID=1314790 RepID=A0A1Y1X7S8_9FUNG|nr:hypothetical protein K493DRAFT_308089 [Basidiobolus meristosporus CBS 931.73]|eukprot:ORX81384.1 hypothetical protein K493DRAFT_308089 [Basidiobolus meristosporus CBS 931.73]
MSAIKMRLNITLTYVSPRYLFTALPSLSAICLTQKNSGHYLGYAWFLASGYTRMLKCSYADTLLNLIDTQREYIKHRFFMDSCVYVEGNYIKDLRILGRDHRYDRQLAYRPPAFSYQIANEIPIKSWYDDPISTSSSNVTIR